MPDPGCQGPWNCQNASHFYGRAWIDLKTFQVFNQQPMVHIGLQREPSEASPFRRCETPARGRSRPSPWARLMLRRWKKCLPITIINNQKGWQLLWSGLRALVGFSLPLPCIGLGPMESISPTTLHQAPGERTEARRNHISHTFSFKM